MGAREYLPDGLATDGGDRHVHYECIDCGTNLDADRDRCPNCEGDVVSYDL